jgi:hypothetical protein
VIDEPHRDLVKVVITSSNRREWLAEAVDSVLAQTHDRFHVVIVDDASSDGSDELARAYAAADPARVTAIVKPANLGVAHSLVVGIGSGPVAPFAAFLNDDDCWHSRKLERQLESFERNPGASLVFTDAELIDQAGRQLGSRYSDVYGRYVSGNFAEVMRRHCSCASTLMVRREVAEQAAAAGLGEAGSACDFYLTALAASRHAVIEVPEPLAYYRFAESGMHLDVASNARTALRARERLFADNPELVELVEGPRRVRRTLALCALDDAVTMVYRRLWRIYAIYAAEILKQRSARALAALVIHTFRVLRLPPRPFMDDVVAGRSSQT